MFTEDLSGFLDVDGGFAVCATWSGGGTVDGIFDNEYALGGGEIESTAPAFLCAAASVPDVAHGQTLTIAAVIYTIVEIQPDLVAGMTTLRLRKS